MTELAEAKYSAPQLQAMLAKGQAMKNEAGDPSYPIADKDDLANAIKAVGRGSAPSDKVKAFITKRARELKADDMIPADWKSASAKGAAPAKKGGAPKKGVNPFAAKESADDAPDDDLEESSSAEDGLEEADGDAGTTGDGSGTRLGVELVEAPQSSGTGRRRKIQLISAGWSKNGRYYSDAVLREAAQNKIFPAGTPMYVDHPTLTEREERPERSILELAARLDTDARYENGALVSEATHFGMWHPVLNGQDGLADNVEISVRCVGDVSEGTAEGREGLIIHRITKGRSVDYVTEGAAGGKVLELIESIGHTEAAELEEGRNIGAWLEAQMHSTFTGMSDDMYGMGRLSREERISLSNALGDALQAFVRRVESDQPQLYKRDLYQGPENSAAISEAHDPSGTTGQKDADMTESQSDRPTPGTTRALVQAELAEARRERDLAVARERARELIPQALLDAWITPAASLRITESVMSDLPVANGKLNEVELAKAISRHVEQAERETAEALEAAGVGSPRDLGKTSQAGNFGFGVDRGEIDGRLRTAMRSLGLSESATETAVRGRN